MLQRAGHGDGVAVDVHLEQYGFFLAEVIAHRHCTGHGGAVERVEPVGVLARAHRVEYAAAQHVVAQHLGPYP